MLVVLLTRNMNRSQVKIFYNTKANKNVLSFPFCFSEMLWKTNRQRTMSSWWSSPLQTSLASSTWVTHSPTLWRIPSPGSVLTKKLINILFTMILFGLPKYSSDQSRLMSKYIYYLTKKVSTFNSKVLNWSEV